MAGVLADERMDDNLKDRADHVAEIEKKVAEKWNFKNLKGSIIEGIRAARANRQAKSEYLRLLASTTEDQYKLRLAKIIAGQKVPMPRMRTAGWSWERGDIPKQDPKAGYSVPVRSYDTHPNRRFQVGDTVSMVEGNTGGNLLLVAGTVISHEGEDRVHVQWPTHVGQEDTDDLVRLAETAGTVQNVQSLQMYHGDDLEVPKDFMPERQMIASKKFRLAGDEQAEEGGQLGPEDAFIQGYSAETDEHPNPKENEHGQYETMEWEKNRTSSEIQNKESVGNSRGLADPDLAAPDLDGILDGMPAHIDSDVEKQTRSAAADMNRSDIDDILGGEGDINKESEVPNKTRSAGTGMEDAYHSDVPEIVSESEDELHMDSEVELTTRHASASKQVWAKKVAAKIVASGDHPVDYLVKASRPLTTAERYLVADKLEEMGEEERAESMRI